MTPEDKEFARACLEEGRLSIEEVEKVKRLAEERNAPFREIAAGLGLIEPPPAKSPAFTWAIGTTLVMFVIGCAVIGVVSLRKMRVRDVENARLRAEAERTEPSPPSPEAGRVAAEIEAERRLLHAQDALRYVEGGSGRMREDERVSRLEEALAGLDAYLAIHPDRASVRCDRARVKDLLGRLSEALEDYEACMRLEPALAGAVRPRAEALRAILGGK